MNSRIRPSFTLKVKQPDGVHELGYEQAIAAIAEETQVTFCCTMRRKRGAEIVQCGYKAPPARIGNVDPKLTEDQVLKPVCRRCATDILEPRGIATFNLAGTIRRRVEDHEARVQEFEAAAAREVETEEAFADFASDMRIPQAPSAQKTEPEARPRHGHRIGDDPALRQQLRNAVPATARSSDGPQQHHRPGGKKARKAAQQPAPQAEHIPS